MIGKVAPSKAMEPGVGMFYGYQAMCNDDACARDEVGVWAEGWYRWWGDFRETWIDAHLDLLEHNAEAHPEHLTHQYVRRPQLFSENDLLG